MTYLKTDAERAPFKLEAREVVINGKKEVRLFNSQGQLFDTRSASTANGEPHAIFAMDANGQIYASMSQEVGRFHHSSFLGGAPVAAAGELTVIDGKIIAISNRSGHYWPDDTFTTQALDALRSKGVELHGVSVWDQLTKTQRVLP